MASLKQYNAIQLRKVVDDIETNWPKTKSGRPKQVGMFSLQIQRELIRRAAVRVAKDCNKLGMGFTVTVDGE